MMTIKIHLMMTIKFKQKGRNKLFSNQLMDFKTSIIKNIM